MGTLHGGVLCDIADAAMGMAYASTLEENERLVARASSTCMTLRGAQAAGR
jgi:acyl-coenzyme A thioesterase PaaI-like protein